MSRLADRFELRQKLGQGGLATVHLALDLRLGQLVALKLIHEHLLGDPAVVGRFRQELAITRLARHPHIVEQYEFHVLEDGSGIAMEYLAGGDLKSQLLRSGPLPLARVLELAQAVLAALGHAHGKGIVHRDVKPHNILFTADGVIKVSDFGLARLAGGEGWAAGAVDAGTPDYCPPEHILGQQTDARSDLYALAATLHELLCGRPPFVAATPLALLRAQLSDPPPDIRDLVPGLPPALAAALQRGLAKDPLDRFQSAAEFAAALRACQPEHGAALRPAWSGATATAQPESDDPASAAAADHAGLACPECGRLLGQVLPYCFYCQRHAGAVRRADRGTRPAAVIVTGPGEPGGKLGDERRQALLPLLASTGLATDKLAKRLPRLPFRLASGLSADSARRLAALAERAGLTATATGLGDKKVDWKMFTAILAKGQVMWPRIVSSLLWSGGGIAFMYVYLRFILDGSDSINIPVGSFMGVLSLIGLIVTFFSNQTLCSVPVARRQSAFGSALAGSLASLQAGRLAPALQGLAHGVARKLDRLVADESTGLMDAGDQTRLVAELTDWAELCRNAQQLDDYLRQRPWSAIQRDLVQLEQRRSQADPVAPELIHQVQVELGQRRDIERTLDCLFDRILSFNTRLDAICLGAAAGDGAVHRDLAGLSAGLTECADLLAAVRQLEAAAPPAGPDRLGQHG